MNMAPCIDTRQDHAHRNGPIWDEAVTERELSKPGADRFLAFGGDVIEERLSGDPSAFVEKSWQIPGE